MALTVTDLINSAETALLKVHANTQTEKNALASAHSALEQAKKMLAPPVVPPPVVTPPVDPPPAVIPPPVITPPPPPTPAPPTGDLIQAENLKYLGAFKLPADKLGSQWGFGNSTGGGGLGTYGVTFNPGRDSLFIGGHPYEQKLAEIKIPATVGGTASALVSLIDPLEGKIGSINPGDPNTKIIGGTLVVGDRLLVAAYSYYDGAAAQKLSWFSRPVDLSVKGQVVGPVQVGSQYPGWVDRSATLLPAEWGLGPVGFGGGGGAINGVQSWGPALSVGDPAGITEGHNIPATLVLGYPIAHPLADTAVGNAFWSQADVIAGVVAIPGTRSVLFFGKHGMGKYCYGTGADCGDKDDSSKGTHAYPYRSQVWAYDAADLQAVKAGTKASYDVKPYAAWELDPAFKEIQGVAFDPATRRLYVSQVAGDPTNSGQPLLRVYQLP